MVHLVVVCGLPTWRLPLLVAVRTPEPARPAPLIDGDGAHDGGRDAEDRVDDDVPCRRREDRGGGKWGRGAGEDMTRLRRPH